MASRWIRPEMRREDTDVQVTPGKGLRETLSAYSAPGKVFLLGEYAVLEGLPAIVASVEPRFRLQLRARSDDPAPWPAHPQSPVSRLMDWAGRAGASPETELDFQDPFEGRGGFGGSTAQFALAYRALAEREGWDLGWKAVWRLYRELMRSWKEAVPPSGADLVAQWLGGVILFSGMTDPALTAEDLGCSGFDWSSLLVFAATGQPGRKVATHEHLALLAGLGAEPYRELEQPLSEGIEAVGRRDCTGFGRALCRYARVLGGLGLECEATRRDRMAFEKIPGVLGVKGAGAMQSDGILVLVDPMSGARAEALALAKSRQLELLCDGVAHQRGVICDE